MAESKHIRLLAENAPVGPVLAAVQAHPELWNQQTARTEHPNSPHHEVDDIWVRYADPKTVREDGSHESIWYPPADVLPVRELVFPLMAAVGGEKLGGILITRVPAGKQVKPHTDLGWHARHYDKFAIQLQGNREQAFHFDDGALVTKAGDLYTFDNAYRHWVTNPSSEARITLIACIRTERTGS
jgi:hypothetical protein